MQAPRAIKAEKTPASNNLNTITAPDFSSLLEDDEISTTGDWINQPSDKAGSVVTTTTTAATTHLKTESGGRVKLETPVMEGSAKKDGKESEWCAVCHDGGDTLYCCDNCPKVYHMFCYIPPLTSEPADDWVCLMCCSVSDIKAVMAMRVGELVFISIFVSVVKQGEEGSWQAV